MANRFISGFLEAVSALTVIRPRSEPSIDPRQHTWCLVSFPLVGLLFGLVAVVLVKGALIKLPVFTAWLVPTLWLALSGAQHFLDLSKLFNALLVEGSAEQRTEVLRSAKIAAPGVALALIALLGKMFALMQAQVLDPVLVSLTVLLVPAVSRYTSLLLAISTTPPEGGDGAASQGVVVLWSSLILVLLSSLGVALMVSLLVAAMLTAVIIRGLALRRFNEMPPSVLGATLELSESVLLWIPILAYSAGIHLGLFSVRPLFS